MNDRGPDVPNTITRRQLLAIVAGLVAGLSSLHSGRFNTHGVTAARRDVCYWENIGAPYCSGGRIYQRRCEVCCAGGVCETVRCITVDLGGC